MNESEKVKEEYYYPMLVSYQAGVKDTQEVFLKKWNELDQLDETKKNILTSQELVSEIKKTCEFFRLNVDQSTELTRIIRDIFFGKISANDISAVIPGRIMEINSEMAQKIAFRIRGNILKLISEEIEGEERKVEYVKVAMNQAIRDFPKINDQKITAGFLNSKESPYPLQPTVKNWIADYYRNMGAGSHNIIDRGNYLFHSANTKGLNNADRQKLAIILKSLSEGVPVLIDRDRQQIIFPEPRKMEEEKKEASEPVAMDNIISNSNASQKTDEFQNKFFGRQSIGENTNKKPMENIFSAENQSYLNKKNIGSDGIRPTGGSVSQFKNQMENITQNQPRFKIQDVAPSGIAPVNDFSGEQLRREKFEKNIPMDKIKEDDLGKIEFSSSQVMPAEKNDSALPIPSASRRISPIGRNGNVL
jgi:hypothetical protein